MNDFILCTRNEHDGQFGIKEGSISYLRVPNTEQTPLPQHKMNNATDWLLVILDKAKNEARDVVFFIHGYNNDGKEALERQRLIKDKLAKRGFPCIVIGFDWPSAGSVTGYLHDRTEAIKAASSLVTFGIIPFALFSRDDCKVNVYVMAHSMGVFVVREAFRSTHKHRKKIDWRVNQLVFIAGDISSDCFELNHSEMLPVFNHCGRLTNYFSGYDEALAVSNWKNLETSDRVGRIGMPPPNTPVHRKALDVNCGNRYAKIYPENTDWTISHSWYFADDVWNDDLVYTLKGQIDRNCIPTRSKIGENDFVLNP